MTTHELSTFDLIQLTTQCRFVENPKIIFMQKSVKSRRQMANQKADRLHTMTINCYLETYRDPHKSGYIAQLLCFHTSKSTTYNFSN